MQITVFGASGKVGRLVVAEALQRGHTVIAFVHSRNPFENTAGVTVAQGNIRDPKAVKAALDGSQAAISALGSWGTKSKNVVSSGMKNIIPAMEDLGVKRLITVTGSGASWSGDKPGFITKLGHLSLKVIAPKILKDGEDHLQLLETSDLLWSCVRSPVMTSGKGPAYKLDFKAPALWASIPRIAVADCLIDLAENKEYPRQAPFIHHFSG